MLSFNKVLHAGRHLSICLLFFVFAGQSLAEQAAGALRNHGDPSFAAAVSSALVRPASRWQGVFRWLQIGDSHTAGDYFTGEIRRQLQQRYGNAGIGWVTPGYVKNQRHDGVKLSGFGDWQVLRATRAVNPAPNPPLGGFVAIGGETASGFRITFKTPESAYLMRISVLQANSANALGGSVELASEIESVRVPQDSGRPGWELHPILLNVAGEYAWLKASGSAASTSIVGGLSIERLQPGVVVSAMGVNGAQIDEFLAWDESALASYLQNLPQNLVVLAFGTNEAFAERFDAGEYAEKLTQAIRRIRRYSQAAVLLLAPPDVRQVGRTSAARRASACGDPPANLALVDATLEAVARREKTLFWSWRRWGELIGATCGTASLAQSNPPLARPDRIHLTPEGYQRSADRLLKDLFQLAGANP